MGYRKFSSKRQAILRSLGDFSTHERTEPVVHDCGDHYLVEHDGGVQVIQKGVPSSELNDDGDLKSLFGIPVLYTDEVDQWFHGDGHGNIDKPTYPS